MSPVIPGTPPSALQYVRRVSLWRGSSRNQLIRRPGVSEDVGPACVPFPGIFSGHGLSRAPLSAGLGAAAAVGDDRLQRMSTGRVSPESFTHGTSAQRVRWLKTGLDSGRIESCDTFSGAD